MTKFYAICTISGAIQIVDRAPADGEFGLAVGEFDAVIDVIAETSGGYSKAVVPGVVPEGDARTNVRAIARYIQVLGDRDVPGFRALGV